MTQLRSQQYKVGSVRVKSSGDHKFMEALGICPQEVFGHERDMRPTVIHDQYYVQDNKLGRVGFRDCKTLFATKYGQIKLVLWSVPLRKIKPRQESK